MFLLWSVECFECKRFDKFDVLRFHISSIRRLWLEKSLSGSFCISLFYYHLFNTLLCTFPLLATFFLSLVHFCLIEISKFYSFCNSRFGCPSFPNMSWQWVKHDRDYWVPCDTCSFLFWSFLFSLVSNVFALLRKVTCQVLPAWISISMHPSFSLRYFHLIKVHNVSRSPCSAAACLIFERLHQRYWQYNLWG